MASVSDGGADRDYPFLPAEGGERSLPGDAHMLHPETFRGVSEHAKKGPGRMPSAVVLKPSIARAARAYTGLSHVELGKCAGVSSRTVFKLEKDGKVTRESLQKVLAVFKHAGVIMLYDDHGAIKGMEFRPKG
ncbi:hypothetical protein GOE08_21090 [Sinorhizobium medicae]|nr:hypothetical protein [Sinorhizobium medicae]